MDYSNDDKWEDANNAPVTDEMNGRFVHYMQETTAMWLCTRGEDDTETFPAPVLILEFTLRNGDTHQVVLQPAAATALNGILADHWGRVWGMLSPVDAELSDDALDKLINDVRNGDDNGSD